MIVGFVLSNFKMQLTIFIVILCFLSVSSYSKFETKSVQYKVPVATIKAFSTKGFSVSIPDSPGLRIFAFHGNVNSVIGQLEGGTFSKDVLQPENGFWIFRDTSVKLKAGDVINYWLFVEKDGLGYRQDSQKFVVKELYNDNQPKHIEDSILLESSGSKLGESTVLSGDIHHYHHYYNETSGQCQTESKSNEFFGKITNQLNVVLMQLQSLHDKTGPLKEKIDSLEEVIGELLKDKDNRTMLLLIGNNPPHDSNVYDAIRGVITDALELHDLSSSIKFAKLVNSGIKFEVKNSIEKYRILVRARERFNTDKRKIVDYHFNEEKKSNSDVPELYFRAGNTEKSVEEDNTDVVERFLFE